MPAAFIEDRGAEQGKGAFTVERCEPGCEIVGVKVRHVHIGRLVSLQVLPGKISQRTSGQRRVVDAKKYEMRYLRAACKVGSRDETKNAHEVVFRNLPQPPRAE